MIRADAIVEAVLDEWNGEDDVEPERVGDESDDTLDLTTAEGCYAVNEARLSDWSRGRKIRTNDTVYAPSSQQCPVAPRN